jgi:hypothetical protein
VIDVSAQKCGWDVTSLPKARGRQAAALAPHRGQGPRQGPDHDHGHPQRDPLRAQPADKFILAVVLVDGEQHEGPFYVHAALHQQEPDWAVTSINLERPG